MPNTTETAHKRQIYATHADLFSKKDDPSSLETQVLCGETVELIRREGDWSLIQADLDSYSGYVRESELSPMIRRPSHRTKSLRSVVYKLPTFKSEQVGELAMNSRILVSDYHETGEGVMVQCHLGWVFDDQLIDTQYEFDDFVTQAMKFLETPYGWGKRFLLVDCSALVQQACVACGVPCERDVGPQSMSLGVEFPLGAGGTGYSRGSLIFWTQDKGRHVAIMLDNTHCIHATIAPPHRGVVIQPLAEVIHDQLRDGNGVPTVHRRLQDYMF